MLCTHLLPAFARTYSLATTVIAARMMAPPKSCSGVSISWKTIQDVMTVTSGSRFMTMAVVVTERALTPTIYRS